MKTAHTHTAHTEQEMERKRSVWCDPADEGNQSELRSLRYTQLTKAVIILYCRHSSKKNEFFFRSTICVKMKNGEKLDNKRERERDFSWFSLFLLPILYSFVAFFPNIPSIIWFGICIWFRLVVVVCVCV